MNQSRDCCSKHRPNKPWR